MANITFNSFRAGSGSYQAVRPLNLTPSAVPPQTVSVETYSGSSIGQSSIADLAADSNIYVSGPSLPAGLILISSRLLANQVLELTFENQTANTITPVAQQFNLLVL